MSVVAVFPHCSKCATLCWHVIEPHRSHSGLIFLVFKNYCGLCRKKINIPGACANKKKCLETGILIFLVYTRIWISRFLTIPLNMIKSGIRLITRILKSLWTRTAMLLSLRTHTFYCETGRADPSTLLALMGECSKGTHAGDINVNTSIIVLHVVKCYWKFSPMPQFANLLRSSFKFLFFPFFFKSTLNSAHVHKHRVS